MITSFAILPPPPHSKPHMEKVITNTITDDTHKKISGFVWSPVFLSHTQQISIKIFAISADTAHAAIFFASSSIVVNTHQY